MKRQIRQRRGERKRRRTFVPPRQRGQLSSRDRQLILKLGNEVKVLDTLQGISSISSAGVRYGVSNIALGTNINNRIGRSVKLKDVLLRFTVVLPASATFATQDTHNRMRIILFRWMTRGSPTVADVLATPSVLSGLNVDNFRDVHVLRDELVDMHVWSSYDDGTNHQIIPDVQSFKWYHSFAKTEDNALSFNAAAGIEHGSINVLVISDSAIPTHPTIEFNARIKFYD